MGLVYRRAGQICLVVAVNYNPDPCTKWLRIPWKKREGDKSQMRLVKTRPFAAEDNKWHVAE